MTVTKYSSYPTVYYGTTGSYHGDLAQMFEHMLKVGCTLEIEEQILRAIDAHRESEMREDVPPGFRYFCNLASRLAWKDESLKSRIHRDIQMEFPTMTDEHFAAHGCDLHIYPDPSVHNLLVGWLKANYRWYSNITWFMSPEDSGWIGAGKLCMDVPFAG